MEVNNIEEPSDNFQEIVDRLSVETGILKDDIINGIDIAIKSGRLSEKEIRGIIDILTDET